jgi:hypothetical protein
MFTTKSTKKNTKITNKIERRDLNPKNICDFCVLLCALCGEHVSSTSVPNTSGQRDRGSRRLEVSSQPIFDP